MKLMIGENLKKLRARRNVTQEALANYLGVTYQAVSRWENDIVYPDIELIPEIARFFAVSLEEIMGCENGEKEAEEKARIINNNWWGVDPWERVGELRELARQYPNNWAIREHLCFALVDLPPEAYGDILPELRRYVREALAQFPPENGRKSEWFCRAMVMASPEEEVEEWASHLPGWVEDPNSHSNVMRIRYQNRKEWEKARHYESHRLLKLLTELGMFGPISGDENIPRQVFAIRAYIRAVDGMIGVPYRDADGHIHNSLMLNDRLERHFTVVFLLFGAEDDRTRQEGFAALEETVDRCLLLADALQEGVFTSDNPYIEAQTVSEWGSDCPCAVDWCLEYLHLDRFPSGLRTDQRILAQLQRLYDKKAEMMK